MLVFLWMMTFLLLLAVGWSFLRVRRERKRLLISQASLHKVVQKAQSLEEELRRKADHRDTTEEKLRGYLQLLDALINTMPNPIFFKDQDGIFQGCNKMFARNILGLTRDLIIGQRSQNLNEVIPPDLAGRYQREELKMIEKHGFHTFEAPVRCADGKRRDFLFSLAPVWDHKDDISGWVAVLADLTEKNQAAWDRLQREKLESVLETAGAVCHEMNQPLQALSGFAELLAAKTADESDIHGYLVKIMEQIERMSAVTGKLQGITRYETMAYSANSKIIDIHKSSN